MRGSGIYKTTVSPAVLFPFISHAPCQNSKALNADSDHNRTVATGSYLCCPDLLVPLRNSMLVIA